MTLPSSVNANILHVGLPADPALIEQYRKDGGKIMFFVTPEEREKLTLGPTDAGVTWNSDDEVQAFLFGMWPNIVGWTIAGNDAERMKKLAQIMVKLVELQNFDTESIKFLTKDQVPTKNALQNFRYIEDGISLYRAKGRYPNTACVIIAAGPSLDDQWEDLRKMQQEDPSILFIVCGRSYTKAMEAGITPQFVVEVEQFEWDDAIWMFAPKPTPEMVLAFPLVVCPGVPRAWPGEKLVLIDHNTCVLMGWRLNQDSIGGGNSVLHHMVNLALFLGCGPIALAGADLGYPDGRKRLTHAVGTFAAWPKDILRNEHTYQEGMMLPRTGGGEIEASLAYQNFRVFLEIQLQNAKKQRPDLRFFNFSPRGQFISGTDVADVKTWRSKCLPGSPLPPSSPPASPEASSSASSSITSSPASSSEAPTTLMTAPTSVPMPTT